MYSTDKDNRSDKRFRRQGILGWYKTANSSTQTADRISAMRDAFQTQLPISTLVEPGFELATTGNVYQISDGPTIITAGRPYFRSKDLQCLAKQQGIGAALASGYKKYSQEVIKLLFGPFCCAIIDTPANRAIVAIDRLGQEAMYYHATDEVFYFGSSASTVLASEEGEPVLLNQGIYNYVYFHMVPSPGSVYNGLKKLPAAHYVDYHNGHCRLVNYWQPEFSDTTNGQSFEQMSKQLKETMRISVENCLSDAGKVGSFLSGGLDSSTVTGLLAEVRSHEVEAYSIGFSAEGYDEMAYARITARHFDVKLNEY
jgi:asparagine synthase (glutamine-hydrolysing)